MITKHQLLGHISNMQEMMTELLMSVPEEDCYRTRHADLPPMAWLLGRCVYVETWWIREVVQNDHSMTARVKDFFGNQARLSEQLWQQLPPREHLLNWALELQENNLLLIANDTMFPAHPVLENDQLLWLIAHEYATRYEQLLMQMLDLQVQKTVSTMSGQPLRALPPSTDHAEMHGGHYRIGAKDEPFARDNELPTQIVELSSYRIDINPVSNGAWLGFIRDEGYQKHKYWSPEGWEWVQTQQIIAPYAWKKDALNNWFGIGLNGSCDLIAQEPVSGICQHEAKAYANWVSSREDDKLQGAVVQHEYQWEAAVRSGALTVTGQVWEWCANSFEPYTGYNKPAFAEAATLALEDKHYASMRGASLHTSQLLGYPSYRAFGKPHQRHRLSGTRLVFPPSDMPWH